MTADTSFGVSVNIRSLIRRVGKKFSGASRARTHRKRDLTAVCAISSYLYPSYIPELPRPKRGERNARAARTSRRAIDSRRDNSHVLSVRSRQLVYTEEIEDDDDEEEMEEAGRKGLPSAARMIFTGSLDVAL